MAKKGKSTLSAPKGMHDHLPFEQPLWARVSRTIREVAEFYNFLRIDTPIVERRALFERSLGETAEVVEKQMFALRGADDGLTLRPEGTAPVARAYIEHGLSHLAQPLRLYYEGPMFRHESPQAGRLRQFHQAGFEILSSENDPLYDAQIIVAAFRILEDLKIKNTTILINSIGCRVCRPTFVRRLKDYYRGKKNICGDCKRRLTQNPLRLLDCKNEECAAIKKEAPTPLDSLCAHCKGHFKEVIELLDDVGLPYALDHHLVRGLDYYTKTVFEITTEGYGPSLAGGGKSDYLVGILGGKETPAIGVALGLERIIEVIKTRALAVVPKIKPKIFLIHIGELARHRCLVLIEEFRTTGIGVLESLGKESLQAQLKAADKAASPFTLIMGQKEVYEESIIIRDMKTGAQETVPLKKIVTVIKKK